MKKLMFGVSCAAIAFAGVWGVSESKSEEFANNDMKLNNKDYVVILCKVNNKIDIQ